MCCFMLLPISLIFPFHTSRAGCSLAWFLDLDCKSWPSRSAHNLANFRSAWMEPNPSGSCGDSTAEQERRTGLCRSHITIRRIDLARLLQQIAAVRRVAGRKPLRRRPVKLRERVDAKPYAPPPDAPN